MILAPVITQNKFQTNNNIPLLTRKGLYSNQPINKMDEKETNDLYVVTENGEQCFMWRSNQLTYIAQDRHELPAVLANKFGPFATKLDLSYNTLTSFKNINQFVNLSELILDNNNFKDNQLEFKQNLRLKTLSLNKNKLTNLYGLINSIKFCFPNLEFLSLIGNPLCPSSIFSSISTDGGQTESPKDDHDSDNAVQATTPLIEKLVIQEDQNDGQLNLTATLTQHDNSPLGQQKYRHFIIYHLPNLRFLDSSPISAKERDEALRRCFWMNANVNNLSPVIWQGRAENDHERDGSAFKTIEQAVELNNGRISGTTGQSARNGLQEIGNGNFQLAIMTSEGISVPSQQQQQHPKGVFSKLGYKYTGKNSEGNRFIRNQDL